MCLRLHLVYATTVHYCRTVVAQSIVWNPELWVPGSPTHVNKSSWYLHIQYGWHPLDEENAKNPTVQSVRIVFNSLDKSPYKSNAFWMPRFLESDCMQSHFFIAKIALADHGAYFFNSSKEVASLSRYSVASYWLYSHLCGDDDGEYVIGAG